MKALEHLLDLKSKIICHLFFLLILFITISGSVLAKPHNYNLQGEQAYTSALYGTALNHFQKALLMAEKEGQRDLTYKAMNKYANLLIVMGRNEESIKLLLNYKDSIIKYNGKVSEQYIHLLENLGLAYASISDISAAFIYFRESIALSNKLHTENDARTGCLYRHLSSCHQFNRQYDSAYYFANKAVTICENDKQHLKGIPIEEVYTEFGFAFKQKPLAAQPAIQRQLEILDSAALFFRKGAELSRRKFPNGSWIEALALHQIGNTFNDKIKLINDDNSYRKLINDSANFYYDKDLKIKIRLYGEHHLEVVITYYTKALLATYYNSMLPNNESLRYYQLAIATLVPGYDKNNIHAVPNPSKAIDQYYLSILLRMKGLQLRTLYSDSGDLVYLNDYYHIQQTRIKIWDHILMNFHSRDVNRIMELWNHQLFEEMIWVCMEKNKIHPEKSLIAEAFYAIEKSKNSMFVKSVLQSGYSKSFDENHSEEWEHLRQFRTPSIDDIRSKMLNDKTALLHYYNMNQSLVDPNYVFILTKNDLVALQLPANNIIDTMIRQFRTQIISNNVKSYVDAAYKLDSVILKPALQLIPSNINKLIIIPHRQFQLIPFEALVTTKDENNKDFSTVNFLLRDFSISYALSTTVSLVNSDRKHAPVNSILSFSPEFTSHSELPFSSALNSRLSEQYSGKFNKGKDATLQGFLSEANKFQVLHLGTHSEANILNADSSRIYFTPQNRNDPGYLTLNEIYPLHLNAEMIVLSACETAIGQESYGEGMLSFARAFAYAGCKSSVTTLWKVDDQGTAQLLENFYEFLKQEKSRDDAMRLAKLKYLNDYKGSELAGPFYWSGLILTGESGPIELQLKKNNNYLYFIAFGIISLWGFSRIRKKRTEKFKN